MRHLLLLSLASALITYGCGSDDQASPTDAPGSLGEACYPNDTCDSGLTCVNTICVPADPRGEDVGTHGDVVPDVTTPEDTTGTDVTIPEDTTGPDVTIPEDTTGTDVAPDVQGTADTILDTASDAEPEDTAAETTDAVVPAPICGDGEQDEGEACDDGEANSDAWGSEPHCNEDCSGLAPYCGDGVCEDGEESFETCDADCMAPPCPGGDGGEVGPEGGTFSYQGLTIDFPAGALESPETVCIMLEDLDAPLGYTAYSSIYRLEPLGLPLAAPAVVTLELAEEVSPSNAALFWGKPAGPAYDWVGGEVTGTSISAEVQHLARGFVGDGVNYSPPADTSCAIVHMLEGRTVEPSAVAMFLTVDDCDGNPVTELAAEDFLIKENDAKLSSEAAVAVLPMNGLQVVVSLVLDVSASTSENIPTLITAASELVNQLQVQQNLPVRISIELFSGLEKSEIWQGHWLDPDDLLAKLEEIESYDSGDMSSTNLHGAIIDALDRNSNAQADLVERNFGGAFSTGYVVLFTDGADTAGWLTKEQSLDVIDAYDIPVMAVGLSSPDYDEDSLNELAPGGVYTADSPEGLATAFGALGNQIAGQVKRTYLIGYCSPKKAGEHQVTVELADASNEGIASYTFDATGFAPGCSAEFFETACDTYECGGLGCGACDDQTSACVEESLHCVDNCTTQCDAAGPITNAQGYEQACDQECDSDGLEAPDDNCPFITSTDQTDTDGDDQGDLCDPDDDGDGVNDEEDDFPLTAACSAISQDDCFACGDPCGEFGVCTAVGVCECGPGATGAICETCPTNWTGQNCDACSGGWTGDACDVCPANWTGEACDACYAGWSGEACETCPANWTGENCEDCSGGWTGEDCGTCPVNWAGDGCDTCANSWTGDSCLTCPSNWTGEDCDACSGGWSGENCDTCPGNWTGDDCDACSAGWTGDMCDTCPSNWKGEDCDVCANGWTGESCDTCPSNWTGDECENCAGGWAGESCDVCPDNWVEEENCSTCSAGWAGESCDVCPENFEGDACDACSGGWQGESCDTCHPNWAGDNCDICAGGWTGEYCGDCPPNWMGPAEGGSCEVCFGGWSGEECDSCLPNWTGAACDNCSGGWTGVDCDLCPSNWTGENCDTCSGAWAGENCDVCPGNWAGENCEICSNGWTGAACDVCPSNWSGEDCDSCTGTGCVATRGAFVCYILSSAAIECVGDGATTPPAGLYRSLDVGTAHACAITKEGAAVCWGLNSSGQSSPPGGVFSGPIAGGTAHTCALDADGKAVCWGQNEYGQSSPPTTPLTAITAGNYYTCGLDTLGNAVCWGTPQWNANAADPPEGTFTAISAGYDNTCAISPNGDATCWGHNGYGQSAPIASEAPYTAIAGGQDHSCGVAESGDIVCWGDNSVSGIALADIDADPGDRFSTVTAGLLRTCGIAVDSAGSAKGLWCSGGGDPWLESSL